MVKAGVLAAAALALAVAVVAPAVSALERFHWCGTTLSASDRLPDSSGRQIHVVYAIPADGVDRTAAAATTIAADVEAIRLWWLRHDPARAPRFDRFAFDGCTDTAGSLDITTARLPQPGEFYAGEGGRATRLQNALGLTFAHRFKKYLVFYDGPLEEPVRVCGQSRSFFDRGGPDSMAFVYVQAPGGCRDRIAGDGGYSATAAHELIHLLGALPTRGPPHACPGDLGHPCDHANDVLHPAARSDLDELVLDYGHDDYYAHGGSWPDLQDSVWLASDAPTNPLTVSVIGSGTVSSDIPGLVECAGRCDSQWQPQEPVALIATPAPGWRFLGWTGDCSGALLCILRVDVPHSVEAVFTEGLAPMRHLLTVSVRGSGTVTGTPVGITCRSACRREVAEGSTHSFRARPARGWRLARWGGACWGRGACSLTVAGSVRVQAVFVRKG